MTLDLSNSRNTSGFDLIDCMMNSGILTQRAAKRILRDTITEEIEKLTTRLNEVDEKLLTLSDNPYAQELEQEKLRLHQWISDLNIMLNSQKHSGLKVKVADVKSSNDLES